MAVGLVAADLVKGPQEQLTELDWDPPKPVLPKPPGLSIPNIEALKTMFTFKSGRKEGGDNT